MNLEKLSFRAGLFSAAVVGLYLITHPAAWRETAASNLPAMSSERDAQKTRNRSEPGWLKHSRRLSAEESFVERPAKEESSAPRLFDLPDDPEKARAWARENPQEALAAIIRVTSGASRDVVIETVCEQMAKSNPPEAVLVAEQLGEGCTNLLGNIVEQWAERDASAAKEYIMDQPIGDDRDRLIRQVALALSSQDPVDAASLVAQGMSSGDNQNEAAIDVVRQWALLDSNAALAWARLFPETLRVRALKEIDNVLVARKK